MNIKFFFQAINKSDIDAIQEQMHCDDFDINCFASENRFSALHSAATKGNVQVVRFLLEVGDQYGLNVDSKNIDGVTPLYSAVMRACMADEEKYTTYLEIITLLLNAGANCEERNKEGKTALYHAEFRDKRKIIFNLLRANSKSELKQPIGIPMLNENEPPFNLKNPVLISSASSKTRENSAIRAEKKSTSGFLESIYGLFSFSSSNRANEPESFSLLPKFNKDKIE
jgi:ankyrin repeat protein